MVSVCSVTTLRVGHSMVGGFRLLPPSWTHEVYGWMGGTLQMEPCQPCTANWNRFNHASRVPNSEGCNTANGNHSNHAPPVPTPEGCDTAKRKPFQPYTSCVQLEGLQHCKRK